jgi:hypothetical protein
MRLDFPGNNLVYFQNAYVLPFNSSKKPRPSPDLMENIPKPMVGFCDFMHNYIEVGVLSLLYIKYFTDKLVKSIDYKS